MGKSFLCCLIIFTAVSNATGEDNLKFTGRFSGDVAPHAVVVPRRTDSDGQHISFELSNFHHNKPHLQQQPSYYQLRMQGENFTLELHPSREFLSPHLLIERRRQNVITRDRLDKVTKLQIKEKRTNDDADAPHRIRRELTEMKVLKNPAAHCHYQGHALEHPGSKVALSLCDGMVGLIRTKKHGEFWVEPVKQTESSSSERRHLVFKRSTTVPDSRKKKRRRKRKHEKNCGTRQPRRQTEMQVEWKQQAGKVKVKGRGRSRKSRWKRSVSSERHVEALVVADTSMMRFHEDGYVETYILTIMNMVSSLYQDPSIGNLVNIVVVNIILLEDESDQEGLNVTVNADRTLESFCKWQSVQNYDEEEHPNHHDVAILITREDICARQDSPCGTLGVAHVGGMCQPDRSCNVNEDNGITLAHTIAHELGHNFGMYHDTEKVGCSRKEGKTQHVMTPSFEADTVEVAWSSCSRRDITNFLDKGLGSCLEDAPSGQNFTYPELPAGAMYDAEYQCQLQFGSKGALVCSPLSEICHRLWCVVDGLCTTMLKPAAPGTSCGKHMWCQNQQCVPIGDSPEPIHGGWSDWGEWSECSRSCGAGVNTQERFCNHPLPAYGGRFCIGQRRRHKICNVDPCIDDKISFRAMQCASFNDEAFHGTKYKWVPYFDNADPCELYCADVNDTIIVPWGNSAQDGTPCRVGSRDMCIRGICKHVGCDWAIDSDAQEDTCGVCHGNGDQCDTFTGVYDNEQGTGYEVVVSIPPGARNIHIEELEPSKNYIGIGSETSEEFYLNGKLEITISGEYSIGGTAGLYERDNEQERVHIPGPLREGVIVYVIYRGKYKNPGVVYNYTVPKVEIKREQQFEWVFGEWSVCSATCGTGVQTAQPLCREASTSRVDPDKCHPQPRPDNKMRVCNTNPCPTRWWAGPWQLCTATCGDPEFTLRKRTVLCVERTEQETKVMPSPSIRPQGGIEYLEAMDRRYTGQELALPDADCEGQEKPSEFEPCPNLPACVLPMPTTSEGMPRLDNDFTDYRLGFDELSQNYPREKFERKPLSHSPKKIAPKKNNKRKRKKDRLKKIEQMDVMFRKGSNYKQMRSHALKHMRYNSHSLRHDILL